MHRPSAAVAILVISCAVAISVPAVSPGAPLAQVAGKCKKKNKKHHRRRRCRRGTATTVTGGETGTSGPPGRLLVTERELSASELQLQLSRSSLPAGSTIVEQFNAGQDPHNLVLERQGAAVFAFDTLDPGGDARQTLTLRRGTWTLYCSLLNHRDIGMRATLSVN